MPSVIAYHEVTDRDHWLGSDLREKKFGVLGVTNIRTFIDPTNPARVGVSGDVPDLDAAARLLAIIEPYAGQIATNLGPAAAYAGRLASLLGRHDVADRHLDAAFQIVDAFDWDYHRAAILMARAAARHGSFGQIDDTARSWLQTAAGICVARGLPGMLAAIGELSGELGR